MKPVLALRHVQRETMGSLEGILERQGLQYRYMDLFETVPDSLAFDQASALVILGGPMNVDQVDRYPHLGPEVEWIREGLRRQMPMLGLCLGSQLMAKALGARVYANRVKEIGWYPIELLPAAADDPLFAGCDAAPTVFQWHGDTFDLPRGAVHLARGRLCVHQAFRYGPRAWALQFHVEMTRLMVEDWLEAGAEELAGLDDIDAAAIRRAMPDELPRLEVFCSRVLSRWAELVARFNEASR
jgi:GMP synthase (glutamine-hydrolysing)